MRQKTDNPQQHWLTPEQELMRLRGLRILARMIARRHLREHGLLADDEVPADTGIADASDDSRLDDALRAP